MYGIASYYIVGFGGFASPRTNATSIRSTTSTRAEPYRAHLLAADATAQNHTVRALDADATAQNHTVRAR